MTNRTRTLAVVAALAFAAAAHAQKAPAPPDNIVAFSGLAGRCLEAKWQPGKQAVGSGSTIHTWACTGGANQKWKADKERIENLGTGLCLSVDGGRIVDGQPLVLANCEGRLDQKWVQQGPLLMLVGTRFCADVKGRVMADGTPVILWGCGGARDNQSWRAIRTR